MKILSMTATFGKLNKARLTCGDGLNLIHAPNEGGKSTWAAFWKAMLYGIDTRDRNKKGYLADKTRYQPWSGAPMEGEVVLEWQGRTIVLRRGPRGTTPFGAFSATYADTGSPVPGLTAANCGEMLTGVSREVFERSAFIGSDTLAVTPAPDLERRIAALLSSGQEDVSFSQTQTRLKQWRSTRKVNRSVGLIPKLETELEQLEQQHQQLLRHSARIAALEGEQAALSREKQELEGELELHRRLHQKQLNVRFAQAQQELVKAETSLERLEREQQRLGILPDPQRVRQAQGELQYLNVLKEEIRAAQTELEQADEAYIQAQIAAQDEHFSGLSGEQAAQAVTADRLHHQSLTARSQRRKKLCLPLCLLAALAVGAGFGADWYLAQQMFLGAMIGAGVAAVLLLAALVVRSKSKKDLGQAEAIPRKYGVTSMEELDALLGDYRQRCLIAEEAAQTAKTIRGALNDRMARQENTRTDLLAFVHTFAPEVKDLFGCSAALSRALNLEHDLAAARERVADRKLRLEDLESQGGQPMNTLELLHTPDRTEEQSRSALAQVSARLEQISADLSRARGQQEAMGDPARLYARLEEVRSELTRRNVELEALDLALEALDKANEQLQQRFSPRLNALTGEYLSALTGGRYDKISLDRELEGQLAPAGEVLPHSALFLSRGTTDQLYLALRLAVCALCLEEKPPILLDDALVTFDDARLKLALSLLTALGEEQQILLFTCQTREQACLEEME